MGLLNSFPTLDDKTFEQLVEEARLLIPRYCREWTDHNVHDPGITFVELFAWLAEMQIYQLNRITRESNRRFLELAGMSAYGVKPAKTLIEFKHIEREEKLPARTRIVTPNGDEELKFETEEAIRLLPHKIKSIRCHFQGKIIDRTELSNGEVTFLAFGEKPAIGSSIEIEFDRPLPDGEVCLTLILAEEGLPAVGRHGDENILITPSARIEWDYLDKDLWKPVSHIGDTTVALTNSGKVVLGGIAPATRIRCLLVDGRYEIAPSIRMVRLNTVAAIQIESVYEDCGASDGMPNQKIWLKKKPVVGCSLLLEVEVKNNKGNWEEWIEVEDLEPSAPNDRHYIFDPEKGEIVFGNGLNGLVPPKDSQIRASYQTTTGLKGNIPSKQKFSVFGGGISGENLCEAKGGTAPESIETAKKRAEHYFWSLCRAVTSEDYEQLAIATPGLRVARAKAIPQYSPRYPCFAMPGAVTVVVVPHVREGSDIPLPGEGFLQSVHRHLDMHRLITTDLHVVAPEYAKISVQAKVLLKKKSSREMVKNRIELALREFLDPMKGGPDKKGWPFGRPVYRSEIYQVIDQVDGVEYVTGVRMQAEGNGVRQATDEGKTDSPEEAIKISPVALVHSGQHRLEFIDAEALHGIGRVQDTDC